jgi:hypothetical protein
MSRAAYSRWPCPVCGRDISNAGCARVSHMRKHLREGLVRECVGSGWRWIYPLTETGTEYVKARKEAAKNG